LLWLVFKHKIHDFRNKRNWIVKIWGVLLVKWYNTYKYSDKWTKIGVNIGICLGNSCGNFQLHRFTTSENIAKSFGGYFIWSTLYTVGKNAPFDFCNNFVKKKQLLANKYSNKFGTKCYQNHQSLLKHIFTLLYAAWVRMFITNITLA